MATDQLTLLVVALLALLASRRAPAWVYAWTAGVGAVMSVAVSLSCCIWPSSSSSAPDVTVPPLPILFAPALFNASLALAHHGMAAQRGGEWLASRGSEAFSAAQGLDRSPYVSRMALTEVTTDRAEALLRYGPGRSGAAYDWYSQRDMARRRLSTHESAGPAEDWLQPLHLECHPNTTTTTTTTSLACYWYLHWTQPWRPQLRRMQHWLDTFVMPTLDSTIALHRAFPAIADAARRPLLAYRRILSSAVRAMDHDPDFSLDRKAHLRTVHALRTRYLLTVLHSAHWYAAAETARLHALLLFLPLRRHLQDLSWNLMSLQRSAYTPSRQELERTARKYTALRRVCAVVGSETGPWLSPGAEGNALEGLYTRAVTRWLFEFWFGHEERKEAVRSWHSGLRSSPSKCQNWMEIFKWAPMPWEKEWAREAAEFAQEEEFGWADNHSGGNEGCFADMWNILRDTTALYGGLLSDRASPTSRLQSKKFDSLGDGDRYTDMWDILSETAAGKLDSDQRDARGRPLEYPPHLVLEFVEAWGVDQFLEVWGAGSRITDSTGNMVHLANGGGGDPDGILNIDLDWDM